jgi:hypothetical protein
VPDARGVVDAVDFKWRDGGFAAVDRTELEDASTRGGTHVG